MVSIRDMWMRLSRRSTQTPTGGSTPIELAGLDNVVKSTWLEPIRAQLHEMNPLMSAFWTSSYSVDWGFDEVWPRPEDQPWFGKWLRDYELQKRKQLPPFQQAFADEVDYLSMDMHRDLHRQFHGKQATIPLLKDERKYEYPEDL